MLLSLHLLMELLQVLINLKKLSVVVNKTLDLICLNTAKKELKRQMNY